MSTELKKKRQIAQYKFSKKELTNPSRPDYYSLLKKQGNHYYLPIDSNKQVVFKEDIHDFIINYYENISNPAALRGSLAVYKAIAKEFTGISRRDVESVLSNVENNQLFRAAKTVPVVRPTIPKSIGHLAADTAFIEHNKERLFTILVVVDIFSKYMAARIVNVPSTHQKFSGKSVAASMADILKEYDYVSTVKTDNGTEFTSRDFELVLSNKGIKHLRSLPHNPRSNSFAESAVKSIKVLLGKYLNSINGIYINNSTLQTLVDSYNNTDHSTIKATPMSVHFGTAKNQQAAKANIKKRAVKIVEKSAVIFPTIKVGDNVRVHNRTESSWRRYTKLKKRTYEPQWSTEIFKVTQITRPKPGRSSHYYLSLNGNNITHPFIRQDLLKVDSQSLIKNLPDGHYAVDKVLDLKLRNGKKEYLINWQGWPKDQTNWVKESTSFANKTREYEDNHKK